MRWAALTFAAGVVAALSVAQLAPGQAIERVRVPTDRPAARLPDGLFVVVGSPEEYSRVALRSNSGTWGGPAYWAPENPGDRGAAMIDWEVGFDDRPLNTERVALANLSRDWSEDQRAGISVPHVIGRRTVGTLEGFFVLQVERQSSPAELVVAFPLAPRLHGFVRFLLLRPESERYFVKGSILASSWNRGQALRAMSRVRVEGNLPPSLVTIRPRRRAGALTGFVVDSFRHAVVGVPVALERRSGRGWRRLSRTRTSAIGGYTFRVRPGTYRAVATLAGRFTARSGPLRIRP